MKELFNKKFVYFMWDDELTDKECFVADNIYDLMHDVNNKKYKHLVKRNQNIDFSFPFITENTGYKFAYYDPNYDIKIAYNEGKQIQFQSLVDGSWCDCDELSEDSWDDDYKYRIKPAENEKQTKCMTYRQLAEWLGRGNGEFMYRLSIATTSVISYLISDENSEVSQNSRIRKWNSNEWIKPTLAIYEEDCGK